MTTRHQHGCGCGTCDQQRKQLRITGKALATELQLLDPDSTWQLLDEDHLDTYTRRARLVTADGSQLSLSFIEDGNKPARYYVGGSVTHELHRHQPHTASGMSITVAQHRDPQAIARDVHRKILPDLYPWTAKVRAQAVQDAALMDTLLAATDGTGRRVDPRGGHYHGNSGNADWFGVAAHRRHDDELSFAVGFKPTDHRFVRIETWVPREHAESLVRRLAGLAREHNAPVEPAPDEDFDFDLDV